MSKFIEVKPEDFNESSFRLIGKDLMLVTAEKDGRLNTMTAAWGGFGVMWGRNVAYVVIRPQRYTKEFVDSSDTFSLTFFENNENNKKMLKYLGTVSGRDEDKIKKSHLTVVHRDTTPYFKEARIAVICKKLFAQDFKKESFLEDGIIERWYPNSDFHMLYIAEVTDILIKG